LSRIWHEALEVTANDDARLIHGDLHAHNVVVEDGELQGIIDWGDVCAGDVATDLACVWTLFDRRDDRLAFFSEYGTSADVLVRARGWAVNHGSAMVASGVASHVTSGTKAIQNLLADRADQMGR
jgi:aminoglycoside phosphotransferase (APT) family kinase protein